MTSHTHEWVPLPGFKKFPQRLCECGAFKSRENVIGSNTITMSPGGTDVVRWSASQAATAAGDIGMDTATGRPAAFVNGVNSPLAVLTDIGGTVEDTWFISADTITPGVSGVVDLFNAAGSGSTLKILHVSVSNDLATVAAEVQGRLFRTSTVGTGGATIAPVAALTTQAALPVQVTARTAPTGGAAVAGIQIGVGYIPSRAAGATTGSPENNIVIYDYKQQSEMRPLTLPVGEGIGIRNVGAGTWGFTIVFTIA